MSETIKIENFPAAKLDEARDLLATLAAKATKAAAKTGATLPELPTLTVVAERALLRCNKCKRFGAPHGSHLLAPEGSLARLWGEFPACDPAGWGDGCQGTMVRYDVLDLEVSAGKPCLAGWEFLAVIEPFGEGNLVNRVPGSDDTVNLVAYRTVDATRCDHCEAKRHRSETFLVRADGSDPAVVAGTIRQVGRNCLTAFLGGLPTAALVARLGWEKVLRDLGEEGEGGWGGGGADLSYDALNFLTWTSAVVRKDGWVSKGAARAYNDAGGNKKATADTTCYLMTPPFGYKARKEWEADRKNYAPVEADAEKAVKALAWARALTGTSDYEYKLALVSKHDRLDPKHAGLMASVIGSYDRATLGALAKAKMAAEVKATAPTGKTTFAGEIIKTSVTESQWGTTEKMTVKVTNPDGSVWFAWGTIPSYLCNLKSYAADGTVKVNGYLTRDDLVGRTVEVKATLEAGKDAHFVFMKRPSVEFTDEYSFPRPEAPKAPRKSRAKKTTAEV